MCFLKYYPIFVAYNFTLMNQLKTIHSALISVFDKSGLEPLIKFLNDKGIQIYSTGGTQTFIESLNITVVPVEDVTEYPSILGGRVKTLHPKVFGGILNRQEVESDIKEMKAYKIPQIDLVIVDLYPFEKTVASQASHQEIIEKIDIGGISLIRASAKNYQDTVIISQQAQYDLLLTMLKSQQGATTLEQRKHLAKEAFHVSSHYDSAIFGYFDEDQDHLKVSIDKKMPLRYGENPHQAGSFFGDFDSMFQKLHGKELSYNNLLDIDAAVQLIEEFKADLPTFAILKHNNACGVATRNTLQEAYQSALAGDPVSAFGGILVCNKTIDIATATDINPLFCEVVIAPGFAEDALEVLKEKKNRILLKLHHYNLPTKQLRSCLNGVLVQNKNNKTDQAADLSFVTNQKPTDAVVADLLFASKVCKHTKSNTIVLAKDKTLIASGTGQTSRVDALRQAIEKAHDFGFSIKEAVMASDAFFPFPDCVEIAHKAGINAVIQPGGSIKDQLSIDYCNEHQVSMVFTGTRHFKH